MIFKTPWILTLLPIILIFVLGFCRTRKQAALRFPSLSLVLGLGASWKIRFLQLPFYLRLLTLVFFFIALAGPRSVLEETHHQTEGIDIVLAIDASGSMAAEDFTLNGQRVNRLDIVKKVVKDFIEQRQSDRIGLIAFAGRAYTVSPLTSDYSWLKANLERISLESMEDGTAIGSAISSSLLRLKKSQAKSKIIILLTDGVNNAGKVDPLTAAQAAKTMGVKIYTIGAGTEENVPFPVQDIWGRKVYQRVQIPVDDKLLGTIASTTNGRYFRATDTKTLQEVYAEINKLEKTKFEEHGYREYKELFWIFLVVGLLVLVVEIILSNTVLLRLP